MIRLSPPQAALLRRGRLDGSLTAGPGTSQQTLDALVRLGLLQLRRRGTERWYEVTSLGLDLPLPGRTPTEARIGGGLMLVFVSDVASVVEDGPFSEEGLRGLAAALLDYRRAEPPTS